MDGSDGDLLPEFVSTAHNNVSKGEPVALTVDI